ncbi:MAG: hypothetical protein ACXADH_15730 [Candidatus Kariarchaeaceae archaeon]|jgi:hypothetical protein
MHIEKITNSNIDDDIKALMIGILNHTPEPEIVFTSSTYPEIVWNVIPFKDKEDCDSDISITFIEYMSIARERLNIDHPLHQDTYIHELSYADPKHDLEYVSNLIKKEIEDEDKFLRELPSV